MTIKEFIDAFDDSSLRVEHDEQKNIRPVFQSWII